MQITRGMTSYKRRGPTGLGIEFSWTQNLSQRFLVRHRTNGKIGICEEIAKEKTKTPKNEQAAKNKNKNKNKK